MVAPNRTGAMLAEPSWRSLSPCRQINRCRALSTGLASLPSRDLRKPNSELAWLFGVTETPVRRPSVQLRTLTCRVAHGQERADIFAPQIAS